MTAKSYKGLGPGPGSYTPYDPNDPGFEPGEYVVSKKFASDRAFSFAGRREGKKVATGPGPGQYAGMALEKAWTATTKSDGNISMGSDERIKPLKPYKGPGPGHYHNPSLAFGPVGGGTKSAPNFSLYSRRPPARGDETPGPNYPHYSQFD